MVGAVLVIVSIFIGYRIVQTQQHLAAAQSELESVKQATEKANAERKELQTKLNEAASELKSTESQLAETQSRLDAAQSELENVKQAAEKAAAERKELQTKLNEAASELKSTESQLAETQSRLDAAQSELESAKQAAEQANARTSRPDSTNHNRRPGAGWLPSHGNNEASPTLLALGIIKKSHLSGRNPCQSLARHGVLEVGS